MIRRAILWLVLAAVGLTVLGWGEAEADPGGCVATAPPALANGTSPAMTCTWIATGTTGGYLAATANPWKVTVLRQMKTKWKVVQTIQGGGGQTTPPAGQLSFKRGDRVKAEIFDVCGPSYYYTPCAAAGFLAVMNA